MTAFYLALTGEQAMKKFIVVVQTGRVHLSEQLIRQDFQDNKAFHVIQSCPAIHGKKFNRHEIKEFLSDYTVFCRVAEKEFELYRPQMVESCQSL